MNNYIYQDPILTKEENYILNWILNQYKEHRFYNDVCEQLERLYQRYIDLPDRSKLVHDLASCEFWNCRALANSSSKTPLYWNPIDEKFSKFSKRCKDKNFNIEFFEKNQEYPPKDIILVHLKSLYPKKEL